MSRNPSTEDIHKSAAELEAEITAFGKELDWKQHAEAAEAEVARLRKALQRIADARVGDHRTLHPFSCSDFARQALTQEQDNG